MTLPEAIVEATKYFSGSLIVAVVAGVIVYNFTRALWGSGK